MRREPRRSVLRDVRAGGRRKCEFDRIDLLGLGCSFEIEAIAIALGIDDENAADHAWILLLEQPFVDVEHDRIIMRCRFLGFAKKHGSTIEFGFFVESEIERGGHALAHQKGKSSGIFRFIDGLHEHLAVFTNVDLERLAVGYDAIFAGCVVPKRHLVGPLEKENPGGLFRHAGDFLGVLLLEFCGKCLFIEKDAINLFRDQIGCRECGRGCCG